ncbi:MAG: flagellar hook assembly protein FlgD [Alphaproteobacteria bacterium]|nr:MAG: flagellar hook assembly protein FlgD [Alphaproteobacteria bacterium]
MTTVNNPTTTSSVTQGSTTKPPGTVNTTQGLQTNTSTDPNAAKTDKDRASLGETFDNFLILLTTQLKNQDPLSPMDSSEFTSQLVGFAGVEQAINSNTKLDKMLEYQKSQELLNASGYIGKTVEAESDKIVLSDDQPGKFSLTLDGKAQQVLVAIRNSSGQTVRSLQMTLDAGTHQVSWDGKSTEGKDMPSGIYTLAVTATDERGNPVNATTATIAQVTDVKMDETDGTVLSMSGAVVPLAKVIRIVGNAPTTTTSTTPSSGGGTG